MKDVSYFGSFARTLNVGDTQFMQYKDDNEGPFYLTPEQRQQQKHDRTIHNEFVTKAKTKAELVTELQNVKVECTFGTNVDKVRQLCNQNNISLKHPPQPKVLEG